MGMLKPLMAGGAAALASEDAEAGWVMNNLGKPVLEAWHGGLKGIDRFQDRYLGTGEGAHVYTYGHYMADQRRTAKKYRDDRQREYDKAANYEIWDADLINEYEAKRVPLEFKVGNAPSIFMPVQKYLDITHDAITRYGTNTDAAKDYVTRKIMAHDQDEYNYALDLIQQGNLGDYEIDRDIWRSDTADAMAKMLGMSDADLRRSIMYDVEDSLPPGVDLMSLSDEAQMNMIDDILLERFELATKRYRNDLNARRNEAIGDTFEAGSPRVSKDFEFQIHPDLADIFDDVELVDWTKTEPTNRRQAGLYRLHSDVQYDDLLHWEQQIADHPEAIKMAISSAAEDILEMGVASGRITSDDLTRIVPVHSEKGYAMTGRELLERVAKGNFPPQFSAADFANQFSQSVSPNAFMNGAELSALLKSKGIKGMMYQDGWTRYKDGVEPYYNYVIYDEDLIDIMERGMSTVPMNMLLAMGTGTALGAPVLNKEIAERFPMPQEKKGYLDRVTDPETYRNALAPYVPAISFVAGNIESGLAPLEYPARLLSGITEGIYNLSQGVKPMEAGSQFIQRLKTPYEESANELGLHVMDETNSPALGAAAYTGAILADPSNWVGP